MKIESEKIFKDIEDLLLCRYSEASHENNLIRIGIEEVARLLLKAGNESKIGSGNKENIDYKAEYESLLKRFRHLLESDFIRSYDEWDGWERDYTKDITKLDLEIKILNAYKEHYEKS